MDAPEHRDETQPQPSPGAHPAKSRSTASGPDAGAAATLVPSEEDAGSMIGRYRLLQKIGEGGNGVVYMAEQLEPVRRRVALKVIKLGMDTKSFVARFEAERQALAMMDHPNIAKILDAGATETGRPYFVMELVRGIRINDYCDQNNLPTEERLKLFAQVCNAIQHAHEKGIIHRDVKPSNILITLHDGVPVPKVIDFGIAKAMQGRLTDQTFFTAFEQCIGTPAYMSPEQAEMSGLDIDKRTDIYSLGAMLYELLTGKTPLDASKLLAAGLDAMRRSIREEEPVRPSTKLSAMVDSELTTIAKHRHIDPHKLVDKVRGDLDWIIMKTLEKDRTRRYESAAILSNDIQNFLEQKPVLARPPSPVYRFQKMVRRNKTAFAATATALLAMALTLFIGMRISSVKARVTGGSATASDAAAKGSASASAVDPAAPKPLPMRLVTGIVLADRTGQPLAGALVRVSAPAEDMRKIGRPHSKDPRTYDAKTDKDGRFQIQAPETEKISLDAFAPGYQSAAGTYMSGGDWSLHEVPFASNQVREFTIKLMPALYVAGIVMDESGKPFRNATVAATYQFSDGFAYVAFALSDEDGRFEIFDFPPSPSQEKDRAQLAFENESVMRTQIPDVYKLPEAERRSLRVTMRKGREVRGRLTSASGRPVANTLVDAIPSAHEAQHKDTLTDADGRFVLRGLPDGDLIVRAHSFILEQKVNAKWSVNGADAEFDLRLEPVILKNPPERITLFGMKLADISPELRSAYDLGDAQGVIILDPGPDVAKLNIGNPEEGNYFWVVGEKSISNLREFVSEILRINELEPPGEPNEGCRGSVRIVYSRPHWSYTTHLKNLSREQNLELKSIAARLSVQASAR